MARTRRADYQRSNRIRTLPLSDPEQAAIAAHRLLQTRDAIGRRALASGLLAVLSTQTGVRVPDLVVPEFINAIWKIVVFGDAPQDLAVDSALEIAAAFDERAGSVAHNPSLK